MYIIEQNIPKYLVTKQSITRTVLFTAIFGLAFINFYSPFEVHNWFPDPLTPIQLFLYSSIVILTGVLVAAISRVIMYYYGKKNELSYMSYSIWIIIEIISMAAFYSLFGLYFLDDQKEFLEIFKNSIRNTALIILLPYSILWLYFAYRDKIEILEKYRNEDIPASTSIKKMLPFHDEKGALKFSIMINDLLYLEASDNYVTIHYIDNAKLSKFLIRNSLKNYEKGLPSKSFIRCHRSYIVNVQKVKIIRKEKEGLLIDLDSNPQISLPVSKTYVSGIIESFSNATA